MTQALSLRPQWSTAAFGSPADTTPMELDVLCEHLRRCTSRRSNAQRARVAAETMVRFVLGRAVTSFVLLTLLSAVASMAL